MHKLSYLRVAIIVFMLLSAAGPAKPLAFANPAAVDLLTVEDFLSLDAATVTSPVAGTVLNGGDLGSNGTCTNFPAPCTVPGLEGTVIGGTIHIADAVATTAQTDASTVVVNLNFPSRVADQVIVAGALTGLTLNQGVYDVTSTGGGGPDLTGDLTLNGDENSIFIFRFNDTFITTGTARVLFTGGAQACNVYWTSAAQVTFDGSTEMVGTVFAQSSVDFTAGGATVDGRVIAQTASITFRNTIINNTPCVFTAPTGGGGGGGGVTGLPDTGGAPIRNEDLPWSLMVAGSFSALALVLGIRAYRRTHLPKQ